MPPDNDSAKKVGIEIISWWSIENYNDTTNLNTSKNSCQEYNVTLINYVMCSSENARLAKFKPA